MQHTERGDPLWITVARLSIEVIGALAWPVAAVVIVLLLGSPITYVLTHGNTTVEAPGFKLTTQQIATSAASAALSAAPDPGANPQQRTVDQNAVVQNIAGAISVSNRNLGALKNRRILWVDDTPANNTTFANAFRALGIQVTQALSTDEALHSLEANSFDVVITDMTRQHINEEGLHLIAAMRAKGINTPVVIFAGYWANSHLGQEEKYHVLKISDDGSIIYQTILNLFQK